MELLLSFLWSLGGGAAIFALAFMLAFWWLNDIWSHPADREWWAEGLELNAGRQRYRRWVASVLGRFSAFLARREIRVRELEDTEEDNDFRARIQAHNQRPWSWGLLDLTLMLAVAYPSLVMVLQWVLSANNNDISDLPVISSSHPNWRHYLYFPCGISMAFFFYKYRNSSGFRKNIYILFASILAVIFYFLSGQGTFSYALIAACIFSGATAISITSSLATAMSLSVLFGSQIISNLFVVLGAFSIRTAIESVENRFKRPLLLQAPWFLVLYVLLVFGAVYRQSSEDLTVEAISSTLLFLGFLPLINAVADFGSTGLTRWLLSKGAKGWTPWYALADLVLGFATFLMLGGMMILTFALLARLGAPPLLDLGLLLAGPETSPLGAPPRAPEGSILGSPRDYWWLYLTFLSTLLPTVVHAIVATFSLIAMWPERWRRGIAKGLRAGTPTKGRAATLTLSVLMAASVAVPLTLIWWVGTLAFTHYPGLGEGLVGIFRALAIWSGAIAA